MCINNKHKLAEKIKEKRVAGGTLEEMYVNLWALGVPTTQQRDPQVWGEGPTSPWVVLWPESQAQWTGDALFQFSLPFSLSFRSLHSLSTLHRDSNRSLPLRYAQLGRPPLTTITLHFLCQKRSVLAHCRPTGNIPSLHSLFCIPIHPLSGTKMDGSRVSWHAMQKIFFFWLCMSNQMYIEGERKKRNNSYHHDTDITSIIIILKPMSDSFNI